MLSVTLIIPTLGRTDEIEVLFASLAQQDIPALDCIVIDQNPDGRLDEIVARWQSTLSIRRIRAAPGASRARNIGLDHATGDVVAFPDDDCWYFPALLQNAVRWFEEHPQFQILTVGAKDSNGVASGNRWIQDRCEIRPINAFRTTFCSSIFTRRSVSSEAVRFDGAIGPGSGTRYGCGEETDYILNRLRCGERGFFDRTWHVGHPKRDMLSGQVDGRRADGYGRGMGHVMRKHSLGVLWASFVLYDYLRLILVAIKGDFRAAKLCFHHGRGVAAGYLTGLSEAASVRT